MTPSPLTTLQKILADLQIAVTAAQPIVGAIPIAGEVDAIASVLLKIAQSAIAAHQQVTGQPIDLSLLQPIDPVA